jgi:hypothetical protein
MQHGMGMRGPVPLFFWGGFLRCAAWPMVKKKLIEPFSVSNRL